MRDRRHGSCSVEVTSRRRRTLTLWFQFTERSYCHSVNMFLRLPFFIYYLLQVSLVTHFRFSLSRILRLSIFLHSINPESLHFTITYRTDGRTVTVGAYGGGRMRPTPSSTSPPPTTRCTRHICYNGPCISSQLINNRPHSPKKFI